MDTNEYEFFVIFLSIHVHSWFFATPGSRADGAVDLYQYGQRVNVLELDSWTSLFTQIRRSGAR